jgi:hypothetical protein
MAGEMTAREEAEARDRLLKAVDQALAGDWPSAHLVAQEHEGDALADWIHAVVHRMEGDLGNARYWYRRCRRELREGVSTEAELREIRSALGEREG